jgi:hypothetical protein
VGLGEVLQLFFGAVLNLDFRNFLGEEASADCLDGANFFVVDGLSEFAEKGGKKEPAAHTDTAVNFPIGKANFSFLEGFAPGENVLIDAIDRVPSRSRRRGGTDCVETGLGTTWMPLLVGVLERSAL